MNSYKQLNNENFTKPLIKSGIYVLGISIMEATAVVIGVLGVVNFSKGFYAYVGSAQNNLERRLARHLSKTKRKFWHVDYLLDNDHVRIIQIFYTMGEKAIECKIAKEICRSGFPVEKFGSSDCRCESHLIKTKITSLKQTLTGFIKIC